VPPTVKRSPRRARTQPNKALVLPAIEIIQGRSRKVFAFPVDGKLLPSIASVTRIARTTSNGITGYQRPEVLSHISQIRKYLESADPMLPNAIVVAFDRTVRFAPISAHAAMPHGRLGSIHIPLPADGKSTPGLIVDGQQRAAALREAEVKRFPVFVVGFIAEDEAEQREQFLLVNSTKPLPKGLLYELLPSIDVPLPESLARKQFPAALLERLNHDTDSPLRGMIITPTAPGGVIKDNSVLKMIENSLSDGALFRFRNAHQEGGDAATMLALLKNYWTAVSEAFPAAWGKPSKRSRLMHGAGIVAMGFVMDAISDQYRTRRIPTVLQFRLPLTEMAPAMRWSDGFWDFGPGNHIKWCDLQNTKRHIKLLTDYVIDHYRAIKRTRL
jgi:DGQHR domain-containing protein